MSPFRIHMMRDEAKALPYPEDMRVDWKRLPSYAKKKETMNCLWANPFEASHYLFDLS